MRRDVFAQSLGRLASRVSAAMLAASAPSVHAQSREDSCQASTHRSERELVLENGLGRPSLVSITPGETLCLDFSYRGSDGRILLGTAASSTSDRAIRVVLATDGQRTELRVRNPTGQELFYLAVLVPGQSLHGSRLRFYPGEFDFNFYPGINTG